MTKKLAMLFVIVFALISVCIPTLACEECGNYYMVTTGNVNVRANPDINAKVIGWVSKGEYVEPLNFICTYDGRTWVQVDWGGRDGYISDKYLTYAFDDDDYDEGAIRTSVLMVTTGNVNVREWVSIDSKVVTTIKCGTYVDVWMYYTSSDGRVWAEILNDDGTVFGYISTKYLNFIDEGLWTNLARYMKVSGGRVNVRSYASINAEDIGTVHKGDVFEVEYFIPTADGRIWACCMQDDEYVGFISCKYLEPTKW